jgi:hypothetical protein
VGTGGEEAYGPENIAGHTEPKDDFRTSRAQLSDFYEAGGQKKNLLYRVAFKVQHLAAR